MRFIKRLLKITNQNTITNYYNQLTFQQIDIL